MTAKLFGRKVAYEFVISDIKGTCDSCGSVTGRFFVLPDRQKAFSCIYEGDEKLTVSTETDHRHLYVYSDVCEDYICNCEAHLRSEICWCDFQFRMKHAEKIKMPVLTEVVR